MSDHLIHKHVIHSLHMLMSIDIEHFFTVMMSADFLTENHFKVRFPYNILLKAESNKIRITKRFEPLSFSSSVEDWKILFNVLTPVILYIPSASLQFFSHSHKKL